MMIASVLLVHHVIIIIVIIFSIAKNQNGTGLYIVLKLYKYNASFHKIFASLRK